MNNKMLKKAFAVLMMLGFALYSCKKDDVGAPQQPVQPAVVDIHFSQPEVAVSLGNAVSVTLENFKGTLTQEGQVSGFKVQISGNRVSITAEEYKPGTHTFTFKGDNKTYTLKVKVSELEQISAPYGVFDMKQKPLFEVKYTAKKQKAGKFVSFLMSGDKERPANSYVQVLSYQASADSTVSFTLKAKGIDYSRDNVRYLPDGEQALTGRLVQHSDASAIRILTKLPNGQSINLIIPKP